jgi:hypothetical protein
MYKDMAIELIGGFSAKEKLSIVIISRLKIISKHKQLENKTLSHFLK